MRTNLTPLRVLTIALAILLLSVTDTLSSSADAAQTYAGHAMVGRNAHPIGDINGDGIPDIITDDGGAIHLWLSNGDGTYTDNPVNDISLSSKSILAAVTADLNGDNKPDLVVL